MSLATKEVVGEFRSYYDSMNIGYGVVQLKENSL